MPRCLTPHTPHKITLAARNRHILAALANRVSVRQVAALYGLSPARVCQIRQALAAQADVRRN